MAFNGDALSELYGQGSVKKLYEVIEKIKIVLIQKIKSTFAFDKENRWKFICSIIMELVGCQYKTGSLVEPIYALSCYLAGTVDKIDKSKVIDIYNSLRQFLPIGENQHIDLIEYTVSLTDEEFLRVICD